MAEEKSGTFENQLIRLQNQINVHKRALSEVLSQNDQVSLRLPALSFGLNGTDLFIGRYNAFGNR